MNSIFTFFTPKDKKFQPLFEQAGSNVLKIAEALLVVVTTNDLERRKEAIKEVERLEHVGDDITHTIFIELSKNFITPLPSPRPRQGQGKRETTKPRLLKLSLNLEFLLNSFKNWVAKRSSDRASSPVWGLQLGRIKADHLPPSSRARQEDNSQHHRRQNRRRWSNRRAHRSDCDEKSDPSSRSHMRDTHWDDHYHPPTPRRQAHWALRRTATGRDCDRRTILLPSPAPQVVLCLWLSHWTLCVRNDWSQKGRRRRRSTISPAAPSTLTSRAASMSWLLCLSFSHAYPNPIVRVQHSTCDSRRICRRYFLLASCKHWLHFEAPRFVLFWKLFCSKFYSQN